MNTKMTFLAITLVLSTAVNAAVGDKFNDAVSGLNFKVIREDALNEVEVGDNSTFKGSTAAIPASVSYNEKTYSVTTIGQKAFFYCEGLTTVNIPSSVTTIAMYAFAGCSSLTSLIIPASVTDIGGYFSANCTSLHSISVENGNTDYESIDGVLFDKGATELITYPIAKSGNTYIIPNTVTSIGGSAFANCKALTSLDIPASVVSIGNAAFFSCTGLTSITIPASVSMMGYEIFFECTSLNTIECKILSPLTSPFMGNDVFYKVPVSTCTLYVPIDSRAQYQGAPQWSSFTNIIEKNFASSVQTLLKNGIKLIPHKGILEISLTAEASVSIHSINGSQLFSKVLSAGSHQVRLTQGIYMARINGNVEKVIIR